MKKSYSGLLPPKDHEDVAREVFKILDAIVTDKESLGLEDKWFRFYELGKNKHWRKKSENLTLTNANFISVHRRRAVNTLTDNNPTFNVRRIIAKDDTEDKFKTVLRATEYWWNETEQQDILELSVWNGETYGICIEKNIFDLEKEYGIGEVDTVVVDPYNFGVYPVKCLDIQKAQAVIHYYPMNIADIKRKYGKAADEVVPDTEVLSTLDGDRRSVSGMKDTMQTRASSGTTTFGGILRKLSSLMGGNVDKTSDEAIVAECWLKDYELDGNGIPVYKGFIRCVTAVNGNIVLSDRNNPSINPNLDDAMAQMTYLYDKYPFAKANSNKDPINFWGESDFEQLAGIQMEFNKSLSQFSSLKDKVSGVKFINPETSGVDNNKIRSGVSILRPTTINHGMGWMNPPPIPKELLESVNMMKELFFAVAGTFDLEQANTPGSQVIAYKAIAALLERASTMQRGKIRNYSKLIRDRGRMAVSNFQNWYTEARFISFTEDGDEVAGEAFGPDMIVPMKLSVVSGSTMPRSEVQRREEALTLFDKGVIDAEEVLKTLDWDKHHEVINRMAQGPVQEFLSRMLEVGMPDEMMEYFNQISQIDDKKLERMIERSEIPVFAQLFKFEGMNPDPNTEIKLKKAQAEVDESSARAEKIRAEKEEAIARTDKERASIRQTDERIKIDRANVVNTGRQKEKELKLKEEEVNKPDLKQVK